MVLRNLIILPEAELDLAQAYVWYEEQEFGLGEEFPRCVDACIQPIRRNPEAIRLRGKPTGRQSCGAFPTLFSMSIQRLR